MKNVLITASVANNGHSRACEEISAAMKPYGEEVRELLESAWLATGPKSFERATEIYAIAQRRELPIAAVEAADVLLLAAEYK